MFCLKRAMMKSILNRRKKKNPFDYEKAEAYSFDNVGDGTQNNSYYFSAHSFEKNQSLYTRLGLRDNGNAEVWFFFDNGENTYTHKTLIYTQEESPLSVYKYNDNWCFSFNGELFDNQNKSVQAKVTCEFISEAKPIDFFYNMPSVRTATAMAQDKWSSEYFAEVNKNNSVHYEQEGKLYGTLEIDGIKYEIALPCLRDHSFGRRVWGYMNNHLWLAAVDNDCQLNFSMVSYPSLSVLEVGHLRIKDKPVNFVKKARYNRRVITTGEMPHYLELELETLDNQKLKVVAKLKSNEVYKFDNGDYIFNEGIAEITVNDIKCRGIFEVGFNKDRSRFMNGKQIEDIKE